MYYPDRINPKNHIIDGHPWYDYNCYTKYYFIFIFIDNILRVLKENF